MQRKTDETAQYAKQLEEIVKAYHAGRLQMVLARGTPLAGKLPGSFPLLMVLGSANLRLRQFDAAAGWYKRALVIAPNNPDALNDLGIALGELGQKKEALTCFDLLLETHPDHVLAHNNRGQIQRDLASPHEAIESFKRAIALKPDFAEAHNNLGIVFARLGLHNEASRCFAKAIEIKPEYAEAHSNLGNALGWLGRHEDAVTSLDRALRLNPRYDRALANKLYQQAAICDWTAFAVGAATVAELGISGQAVSPFNFLPFDDDAARNRLRAERFAREHFNSADLGPIERPSSMPTRLEIGYFSADFHEHATLHLIARLFELHDRSRFRIHIFSFGQDSNDPLRERLKDSADAFHEVRSFSDAAIAQTARRIGIHIAVDLKGFTANSRTGIFARRAAPLQINYLGYPGTMGAPFMDYILADRVVIPETQASHYSEKIIYLPHTYQINDDRRSISNAAVTRREVGLPEDCFVYCCFNHAYKISPAEFDIWMRLLGNVPKSVLWLLRINEAAERNLKAEAAKRGVDPSRVIFAERTHSSAHLARHRLADLFLDTFRYNAHTAASDALRSGLPLVTKIGNGFASRVAASLLHACGLQGLVTNTSEAYERLALELAQNPQKLQELKQKVSANISEAPLFDSIGTTRSIEAGFWKAYRRYVDGLPSDVIDVLPEDECA
jgi:protein O-GlcNAc transferase